MSDITLMLASTEKTLTTIAIGEGWNNYDSSKRTIDDWKKA